MPDSLFSRVRRIVTMSLADLCETGDRPAIVETLRRTAREIDGAIEDLHLETGRARGRIQTIDRQIAASRQRVQELARQAGFGVAQDRVDLAEAALQRQQELEAQRALLVAARQAAEADEEKYAACRLAVLARKRDVEAALAAQLAARDPVFESEAALASLLELGRRERLARIERGEALARRAG